VDDGEVDDVRQRTVQELLAVEAEEGSREAADAEQQKVVESDRAPQLSSGETLRA